MRLAALIFAIALLAPATGRADPAFGEWLTDGGKGRVLVAACGERLCATILTVADERPGETLRDQRNPDASLRSRALRGVRVLDGLRKTATGWAGGSGYDPERGMRFRPAEFVLLADGRIRLKGCVGPFCETQHWTRAR